MTNFDQILSKNTRGVEDSIIIKMAQRARDLKADGRDVVSLTIGEPDFDTPQFIKQAATDAVTGIVLLGVIVACSNIGLRWSQIQWLATALTFGLAFGLQEIFANFVAGLIILFERPVRVGDVVTVDDVSGVVSRIRIRANSEVHMAVWRNWQTRLIQNQVSLWTWRFESSHRYSKQHIRFRQTAGDFSPAVLGFGCGH